MEIDMKAILKRVKSTEKASISTMTVMQLRDFGLTISDKKALFENRK
jgi:hypothetical protein